MREILIRNYKGFNCWISNSHAVEIDSNMWTTRPAITVWAPTEDPDYFTHRTFFCAAEAMKFIDNFIAQHDTAICKFCGERYIKRHKKQKLCSKRCYTDLQKMYAYTHYQSQKLVDHTCTVCGKTFQATSWTRRKTCGPACSKERTRIIHLGYSKKYQKELMEEQRNNPELREYMREKAREYARTYRAKKALEKLRAEEKRLGLE